MQRGERDVRGGFGSMLLNKESGLLWLASHCANCTQSCHHIGIMCVTQWSEMPLHTLLGISCWLHGFLCWCPLILADARQPFLSQGLILQRVPLCLPLWSRGSGLGASRISQISPFVCSCTVHAQQERYRSILWDYCTAQRLNMRLRARGSVWTCNRRHRLTAPVKSVMIFHSVCPHWFIYSFACGREKPLSLFLVFHLPCRPLTP